MRAVGGDDERRTDDTAVHVDAGDAASFDKRSIDGNALNITCTSYADQMAFGLTGCRRTVPHLQRILTYLDDEIGALEKAAGL